MRVLLCITFADMKRVRIISLVLGIAMLVGCKDRNVAQNEQLVEMQTTAGTIVLKLYNETPLHRDNFLKLVDDHVYDSLLFHRVIQDFMIQGGDIASKDALPGAFLGENDLPYTVPAEFRIDKGIYHKRGALAAAREGDDVNPQKASSSTQFYIVWGRTFDEEGLNRVQERIDEMTDGATKLTDAMKQTYRTVGGTPHLDGSYTVFGEVVQGLEVVDSIQRAMTDANDRPLTDIRIISARRL